MNGPKTNKTLKEKDMDAIDMSINKNGGSNEVDIEEKKREFLGGDDDDLADRGFIDDNVQIDFSKFKVGAQAGDDDGEEEQSQSIFGKLTSAFKNYTGNKVMTKADIEPILEDFKNNLTDKNVSSEIADKIAKTVEQSLIKKTTASFTSVKTTV